MVGPFKHKAYFIVIANSMDVARNEHH